MSPREIEFLLQSLIDGNLDDEACAELMPLIKEDPEIFDKFCQYAELDASLNHLSSVVVATRSHAEKKTISSLARDRQSRRIRKVTFFSTAAAIITLLLTLSIIWLKTPPIPPATFTQGPETNFTISHSEKSGRILPSSLEVGSSLALTRGTLELNLATGVRAVLEAPALVTLSGENQLQLDHGSIWCEVPEQAKGFQIHTPSLRVTDLGTEFAVLTYPGDQDEVHVFKGQVEVVSLTSKETVSLKAEDALTLLADHSFSRFEADPIPFLTSLPEKRGHFHWSFDEPDAGKQAVSGRMNKLASIDSRCTTRDGEEPYAAFSVINGRFGYALSSFGRNGLVKTNWAGIPKNSPFTLAYWIKVTPGQHAPYSLVSWGSDRADTPPFFSFEIRKTTSGSVTAVTLDTLDFEGTNAIDDGKWHHLAFSHAPSNSEKEAPLIKCYLDGEPEPLLKSEQVSQFLSPSANSSSQAQGHLTFLDHPRVQARTGEKINLSLICENGSTSVFLNGRNIGFSTQSPPAGHNLTHLVVGANLGSSGQLEGFFTGTIDHLKLATFTGSLASRELLGNNRAQIKTIAEYSFDDHTTPPGFQEIGQPTYQNGKLILDGDDALIMSPTPLTAKDNFIMEVSCTMTDYPSNPRRFAFPVSNSDGFNYGSGIIYHHTWGGILMGQGPVGSATTDENKIPIAIDELHLFSKSLRPLEIRNLFRYNDTFRKSLEPKPNN